MIFAIHKSNVSPSSDRWFRGWIEAASEQEALAKARTRWPSKNTTDLFYASEVTPEEYERIESEEAAAKISAVMCRADQPETYAQKCAARRVAYLDQCRKNVLRSLDRNLENARRAGASPEPIYRIAESIEQKFDRLKVEAERG